MYLKHRVCDSEPKVVTNILNYIIMINFFKKLFGGSSSGDRQEGTVKFFNSKKGFGFINVADSEDEIFVHITDLTGKVKEGTKVTFEIEKEEKGLRAVKVRKA